MKLVKKHEAKKITEYPTSMFTEYALPFQQLALGVSEIHGRYPEHGCDVDTGVEQIWYVESGDGVICVENKEYTVSSGDMLLIAKNEKYWIKSESLKLVVASSPPWYPTQHTHRENG